MSTPGFILLMAEFEGIDIELLHPSLQACNAFPTVEHGNRTVGDQ
jgi:hypothetical protein